MIKIDDEDFMPPDVMFGGRGWSDGLLCARLFLRGSQLLQPAR
jgi:hypothetical protein